MNVTPFTQTPALPERLPDGRPWPKISVVTPSYNQGKFIAETILSVLNQGYPNVEHIVIDGGSNDETAAVLEQYRDKLAYSVSEPDRGQSHAINKGMALATGEIVTWLNSDDQLAPGALAAMAIAFAATDADMVAGICQLYSDGQLVGQHLTSCADGPLPLDNLLDLEGSWHVGQFFYQPEVMFKRSLWDRAGGHVDESLYYSMDYELWVRFAEAGARLHVIGRPVAWYRMHAEQKTHVEAKFKKELAEWRQGYLDRTVRSVKGRTRWSEPKTRMRILLVNDHGYQLGAGIAHRRLGEALAAAGHDVHAAALVETPLAEHADAGYTYQQLIDLTEQFSPDMAVVGNLHSAKADAWLIGLLAERCPTLCILHDFWLVTGRCAYPRSCDKYLSGCDASCPTPREYPQLEPEKIADAWRSKWELLETQQPILMAYSNWAAQYARSAIAGRGRTVRIENFRLGFPLDTFRPQDRQMCREALGLPRDRFIVLTTSELNDPRKGNWYLLEALRSLALPDLLLLSTSWSQPEPEQLGSIELKQLGYISEPERLAMVYAAADVFVGPSLEETFGQIFIEAIACGTPVVGFPVTGVAEAIRDGVTGRLADEVTAEALGRAILELYQNPVLRRDIGCWGRIYVENEWSPVASYRHFFQSLDRLGLLEQMRVPHKISFLPAPLPLSAAQCLSTIEVRWPEESDLCAQEGPIPEYNLNTFRWAVGPVTRMKVLSGRSGKHQLMILYRNVHNGQKLTLEIAGQPPTDYPARETGILVSSLLCCEVDLKAGTNYLLFHFSHWDSPQQNSRPLSLLIESMYWLPVDSL